MSEYFIGIDSGTQSTKTILLDAASGEIVAGARKQYELIGGLPAGHKEQHPGDWIAAVGETIKAALGKSGGDRASVRGIGGFGQQNGFVARAETARGIRAGTLCGA